VVDYGCLGWRGPAGTTDTTDASQDPPPYPVDDPPIVPWWEDPADPLNWISGGPVRGWVIKQATRILKPIGDKIRTTMARRTWKFGSHKNAGKFARQMKTRGWTDKQIDEAVATGE